jgi:4-carboxymuconolactone decarboxylase
MGILRGFIFGDVFDTGTLDDQTRELITVTLLSCLQALPQLSSHTGAAVNVGVPPVAIREAVYQLAPFIGFPRTLNAVATINQVFTDRGITLPLPAQATVSEADRYRAGLAVQRPQYGEEIKTNLADLPTPFDEALPCFLTEFCFGDFYTREGLRPAQRELLILCALTTLGDAAPQLGPHARPSLQMGHSRESILAAPLRPSERSWPCNRGTLTGEAGPEVRDMTGRPDDRKAPGCSGQSTEGLSRQGGAETVRHIRQVDVLPAGQVRVPGQQISHLVQDDHLVLGGRGDEVGARGDKIEQSVRGDGVAPGDVASFQLPEGWSDLRVGGVHVRLGDAGQDPPQLPDPVFPLVPDVPDQPQPSSGTQHPGHFRHRLVGIHPMPGLRDQDGVHCAVIKRDRLGTALAGVHLGQYAL